MLSENMDARRMRQHNSQRVLSIVRKHGPISRADITRQSNLTPPTVSALTDCLLKANLVKECGEGESKGGRKPQLISFNELCGVVVGANIGNASIELVLSNMAGEWLTRKSLSISTQTRPKQVLRRITNAVGAMTKEKALSLLSVVVGAPGMTDINKGVVLEAANLEGWIDVPVRDILQTGLNTETLVENDVNLAAIGERWKGCAQGVRDFVFISLGTGIGSGIVIDGQIHRGHKWHAGEISHLNVDFREWNTDFGAAGYLESYIGAVPRKQHKRAPRRHAGMFDDEDLLRLGASVANIATIIDPELIVLGGRMITARPEISDRVREVAFRIAPNCPEIKISGLGADAPLYGSLKVALNLANETLQNKILSSELRL